MTKNNHYIIIIAGKMKQDLLQYLKRQHLKSKKKEKFNILRAVTSTLTKKIENILL